MDNALDFLTTVCKLMVWDFALDVWMITTGFNWEDVSISQLAERINT
jgi:hypothetical protein